MLNILQVIYNNIFERKSQVKWIERQKSFGMNEKCISTLNKFVSIFEIAWKIAIDAESFTSSFHIFMYENYNKFDLRIYYNVQHIHHLIFYFY